MAGPDRHGGGEHPDAPRARPGAPARLAGGAGPGPKPLPAGKPGGTCDVTKTGHLTDCQAPVAKTKLPSGARDKSTLNPSPADLASLVDTRTWTTGGGNTFPGADVPYGMVQWSPDTL